jgi:PAS domain-containing protein
VFDEEDLDFAKHLGRRAAVAVDNARLYREANGAPGPHWSCEHVADGVLLVNTEGLIRLWNPPAEHITGVLGAEALRTSRRRASSPMGLDRRASPRPASTAPHAAP